MNVRAALHRLYLILKSNNMLSNFTLESEKREYKMSQTGKWGTFWILVIGIVVGILCTAGLVGVVQRAGTDKFCTGWCHSMDGVTYAWKQGQHARTPSGYTAGCSDCHLLNETNRPLTPVAYVELLFAKAKAGSISGFGELRGTLNTPQMWLEKRPELSKAVNDWMVSYNFRNCRGCHNLADMYNAKNPMVAKMHAGFIDKPTNCIMCHKTAGHNYKMADEIIKATGKWPDPAKAWEQADAAAKK